MGKTHKYYLFFTLILTLAIDILSAKNEVDIQYFNNTLKFVSEQHGLDNSPISATRWIYYTQKNDRITTNLIQIASSLLVPLKEYFPFEREPSQSWETEGWYRKIAVGDINNDGWDDIVVVGRQPKILIFYNDQGTFNTNPSIIQTISGENYFYSDIALKDFDKDGDLELFLVGSKALGAYDYQCKGIYLYYFENISGEFAQPQLVYVDSNLVESTADIYLKSRDINKDGSYDLVLYTDFSDLINYPICIFYNHSGRFLNEPDERISHPSYDVRALGLVNVNSDKKLDIFITIDTHNYFGWPILGYISENDTLPQNYNWKGSNEIDYSFEIHSIDLNNDSLEEFWLNRYKYDYNNSRYLYYADFYLNQNEEITKDPSFTITSPLIGHIDINNDSFEDLFSSDEMYLNDRGKINEKPLWVTNKSLQSKKFNRSSGFGKFTQLSYLDFITLSSDYDEDKTYFRIFKKYPNDTIPPNAPIITSVVWDEYDAQIHLKWQMPDDNDIQGFALFYTTDPEDSLLIGTGLEQGDSPIIIAIQDSIALSGVTPDTTYWFAIAAIDKGGWRSAVSNLVSVSTHAIPPAPPTNFHLTDLKDGVLWAEWAPNMEEDIDHYRIYYMDSRDSVYYLDVPNTTIYHLTELPCGDTLKFWMTAFDLAGSESQHSDTLSIIPEESKFHFENVTDQCGMDIPGALTVTLADINNDGLIDITFAGENTSGYKDIQLYLNESTPGNIHFYDATHLIPFDDPSTTVPVYIDLDKDGDKDLFLSVFEGHLKYFQNLLVETGQISFVEKTDSVFIDSDSIVHGDRGISFGDLDEDGDLELVVASKKGLRIFNNLQMENGKLEFIEQINLIADDSTGIMPYVLDSDNDGDLDIVYLRYKGITDVFLNQLDSKSVFSFSQQNSGLQNKTWIGQAQLHGGLTWADVNKDGLIDLFLPVITHSGDPIGKHGLYINQSVQNSVSFENISETANTGGEPSGWDGYGYRSAKSATFADFDNDAWPDIFIGNSMGCNWIASNFYRNVTYADSVFFVNIEKEKNIIDADNHKTFTMAFDVENDGDLDILLGKYDHGWLPERKAFYLYENILTEKNHYLNIKLEGSLCNTTAIGSRVEVYNAGFLGDKSHLIGMQCVKMGEAYISYEEPVLHFGLGKENYVDVRVYFPYGTIKDTINIPVNQMLTIRDPYKKKEFKQMVQAIVPEKNSFLKNSDRNFQILLSSNLDVGAFNENGVLTKSAQYGSLSREIQLLDAGKRISVKLNSSFHANDKIDIQLKPDIELADGSKIGIPFQTQFFVSPENGHGNFFKTDSYTFDTENDNSYFAPHLFLGDLNNDGYVDIAKVHYGGNQAFGILLNNKHGAFQIHQTIYINELFKDIVGSDWDNDGDLDLAVRGFAKIFLLTNNGNGAFSITKTFSKSVSITTADIDADGDFDLIFGDGTMLLNNGAGVFEQEVNFGAPCGEMVIGDFNNDGLFDIAAANGKIYSNRSHFDFWSYSLPASSGFILSGDLNKDQWLDLILYSNRGKEVKILLNKRNESFGSFVLNQTITLDNIVGAVTIGDYDADSDMDMMVSYWKGPGEVFSHPDMSLFINNGSGDFVYDTTFSTPQFSALASADLDNDGDVDIVGAVHNKTICILKNVKKNKYGPVFVDSLPVIRFAEDKIKKLPLSFFYPYAEDRDDADSVLSFNITSTPNCVVKYKSDTLELIPKKDWYGKEKHNVIVNDGFLADTTEVTIQIDPRNDPPEIINLPETITFFNSGTYTLTLWNYVKDAETPDSLLHYSFQSENDSLHWSYNGKYGKLILSADKSYEGKSNLIITVQDDSSAVVKDTISVEVKSLTGLSDEQQQIPKEYVLFQNYPNPFNPKTTIRYGLPKNSEVVLQIFNVLGRRIKILLVGQQKAGYHRLKWDGTDNAGNPVASGVYLYQLRAGDFVQTKKMVLMK